MQRKMLNLLYRFGYYFRRVISKSLTKTQQNIDAVVVKKILAFEYNFLVSFLPVIACRVVKKLLPRTGAVFFTLQYKHSLNRYFMWNQFNIEIRRQICHPLTIGQTIVNEEFRFFINAIQMPITFLLLFQVFDKMNFEQRELLYDQVRNILKRLTCKNQDLYCKQLLHLLAKFDLNESVRTATIDAIQSCGPNFVCEQHSSYIDFHSKPFEAPSPQLFTAAQFQDSAFFVANNKTYLLVMPTESLDGNFHQNNLFFTKDKKSFIFFRHKLDVSEPCHHLDNATMFLPLMMSANPYEPVISLSEIFPYDLNKKQAESENILCPKNSDVRLLKYLKGKFEIALCPLTNATYVVKTLKIVVSNHHSSAVARNVKSNEIIRLTQNSNTFSNKLVVMTNSFASFSEVDLALLAKLVKQAGGIFLDINLVPFEDILYAFMNAETVICGDHPILDLHMFRGLNNRTIVLQNSKLECSIFIHDKFPNVKMLEISNLRIEDLSKSRFGTDSNELR